MATSTHLAPAGQGLDHEVCYRAVRSRDRRFDGVFYTAVATTGIYCRPSCPARTPAPANVNFHPTAASAQAAGYRACKRCIPDATPGSPEWDVAADVAGRAMRLIADGVVDRAGVGGLADFLGYSPRQLNRLLVQRLGAGPLALARARRAQTARILIESTAMGFSDVAFAAGFSSVRQFNDTVREVYAASPSELRGRRGAARGATGAITMRLAVRTPFAGRALLEFLARRAVPGVETVDGTTYSRTLAAPARPWRGQPRPDRPDLPGHRVRARHLRAPRPAGHHGCRRADAQDPRRGLRPDSGGRRLRHRPDARPARGAAARPEGPRPRGRHRAGGPCRAGAAGQRRRGAHHDRPAGARARRGGGDRRRGTDPPLPGRWGVVAGWTRRSCRCRGRAAGPWRRSALPWWPATCGSNEVWTGTPPASPCSRAGDRSVDQRLRGDEGARAPGSVPPRRHRDPGRPARPGPGPGQASALAERWRPWRSYAQVHLWHSLTPYSPPDPEET